ncbi:MAG: hypothetical protein HY537_16220 [Deltaproteobacteria bacterium]|nr:hypothetical protein [Deltaproteobacteria bacterium]
MLRKMKFPFLVVAITIILVTSIISCGTNTALENTVEISGVVQLGRVSNASVNAYKIENGARGTLLASSYTNSNGEYSLALPKTIEPVEIVSAGGTYTDEATGSLVTLRETEELSVVLEDGTDKKTAPVTPMTTQVKERVLTKIKDGTISMSQFKEATDAAITEVSQLWGSEKSTIMALPNPPTKPGEPNSDEGKAAFLLATFSQFLKDNKVSPDKISPVRVVNELAARFAQNGTIAGTNVIEIDSNRWKNGMKAAMDTFKSGNGNGTFGTFDKAYFGTFNPVPEDRMCQLGTTCSSSSSSSSSGSSNGSPSGSTDSNSQSASTSPKVRATITVTLRYKIRNYERRDQCEYGSDTYTTCNFTSPFSESTLSQLFATYNVCNMSQIASAIYLVDCGNTQCMESQSTCRRSGYYYDGWYSAGRYAGQTVTSITCKQPPYTWLIGYPTSKCDAWGWWYGFSSYSSTWSDWR